ncbi:MAG TPA: ATP-dependent helicase HrpB [Stellaceae bacterium]|nr:ATP-dependent helicase HrpB [Stellaceae bacterium]
MPRHSALRYSSRMTPRDLSVWRDLPVSDALPALADALAQGGAAVLEAPPGAGKTTLVPLALLDAPWLDRQRIIMLEPRRLAARASAERMAAMLGERVGGTVGYRTRLDTRVGPATRIEVVTEGILPRLLQDDPALEGVAAVIFDEFHERHLEGDLALALTLEARRHLRQELRLLIMSATLDGARFAALIEDAAVIHSEARAYPVEVRYLERPAPDQLETAVAAAIRRALARDDGSVLAFLPGGGEIRRVARLLEEAGLPPDVAMAPLYGDLPREAQDAAIRPARPGTRKIVLATPIAETSLTIEGIAAVVDSGLARVPRFDPASGMTRLETRRISQASAEQRRGRAGRTGPGICYRLWRESETMQLAPFNLPEIVEADLVPLALALARWGTADPAALAWLDPPPAAAYAQARTLLAELGAIDAAGRITAHGREMAALPLHPRLAHMMLRARTHGHGRLAAQLAALLSERDIVKWAPGARDVDVRLRLDLMRGRGEAKHLPPGLSLDRGAAERVRQAAHQIERQLRLGAAEPIDPRATGRVLALAYPDRIAARRPGAIGQFRLANGKGAELPTTDALAGADFLAVAAVDGERRSARIFLAAPLSRAEIEEDFAAAIQPEASVRWESRSQAVEARRQRRLGALVLADEPLADPPTDAVATALFVGIRELGMAALPWTRAAESLRHRLMFLRRLEGEDAWPDTSDAALLATLEDWLRPYVDGITRLAQLARLDLAGILAAGLSGEQRWRLNELAPTHVMLPSGARVAVEYGSGDIPVLAVRLQELFGSEVTPAVAQGRVPLVLHLLSPAGRPLQVTRDLAGFWRGSYPAVRRDMRGRYPKHPWPEDPLHAMPPARGKGRR